MLKKRIELAVVGGGPKSAALAAKAYALRKARVADIHVSVFEKKEIGANWNGDSGYTDGVQRLCTPAERDLGYPYVSGFETSRSNEVNQIVYENFSWPSFLLTESQRFSRWVDGGRKPPKHAEFAEYLVWALKRSEATVKTTEVRQLAVKDSKWQVFGGSPGGMLRLASRTLFDGVVVSGPGPARRPNISGMSNRIFDGVDFWTRRAELAQILKREKIPSEIAIIGAGGTAAAILAWLIRNGFHAHPISLIASQAALYTRGDSVFENRLFSDDGLWDGLSPSSQDTFFKRLNRGVVWSTVMEQVATAEELSFVDGRVDSISVLRKDQLELEVRQDNAPFMRPRFNIVIDASGFDEWWFLDLLRGLSDAARNSSKLKEVLRATMEPGLKFNQAAWAYPSLHVPALSSKIGPGFGSLMALGGMSDRILGSYL